MSVGLVLRSAAKSNEKLENQKYATCSFYLGYLFEIRITTENGMGTKYYLIPIYLVEGVSKLLSLH